jgi:hypothetical protein
MRAHPEIHVRARTARAYWPAMLFVALWIYASAFGLLALVGIRLLDSAMGASALRGAAELVIMAAAALLGTSLSVRALRAAHRRSGTAGRT